MSAYHFSLKFWFSTLFRKSLMLIISVPYFWLFCYLIQNIYCLQHFPLSHQSTFALKLIFTKFYTGASYPRDSSKFQTDTGYPRDSSKLYLGASHQRDSSKLYLRAGYSRNFNSAAVPCRSHQKRLSPVTGAAFPAGACTPISCQSLQLASRAKVRDCYVR